MCTFLGIQRWVSIANYLASSRGLTDAAKSKKKMVHANTDRCYRSWLVRRFKPSSSTAYWRYARSVGGIGSRHRIRPFKFFEFLWMRVRIKKYKKFYVEYMLRRKSLLRSSYDEFNIQKETFQINGKQGCGYSITEIDCTGMATIRIIKPDFWWELSGDQADR